MDEEEFDEYLEEIQTLSDEQLIDLIAFALEEQNKRPVQYYRKEEASNEDDRQYQGGDYRYK